MSGHARSGPGGERDMAKKKAMPKYEMPKKSMPMKGKKGC